MDCSHMQKVTISMMNAGYYMSEITRAENKLYLSSTESYNDNLMTSSPFIDELGDSVKKMKC